MTQTGPRTLRSLHERVMSCTACPRLVAWRTTVAREKVKRFAGETYWGRPIPGFGDPEARLLLVGLAPAAHGGNRTGRMFTGDESGNWLFRALWKAGFANQPESRNRSDGLRLSDCYLTATLRCAPPANKPLPDEIQNCSGFLLREIQLLANVQVVVGLGKIGFAAAVRAYRAAGRVRALPLPAFGHGAEYREAGLVFLASYHPSQQNTFTGRLTEPMLDTVFARAAHILKR